LIRFVKNADEPINCLFLCLFNKISFLIASTDLFVASRMWHPLSSEHGRRGDLPGGQRLDWIFP